MMPTQSTKELRGGGNTCDTKLASDFDKKTWRGGRGSSTDLRRLSSACCSASLSTRRLNESRLGWTTPAISCGPLRDFLWLSLLPRPWSLGVRWGLSLLPCFARQSCGCEWLMLAAFGGL